MNAVILPESLGDIFSLHLNLGSLLPLALEATSALEALVTETRVCESGLLPAPRTGIVSSLLGHLLPLNLSILFSVLPSFSQLQPLIVLLHGVLEGVFILF